MFFLALPKYESILFEREDPRLMIMDLASATSVTVAFVEFCGKRWLRMSASVYNVKEDFQKLRRGLMDFYGIWTLQ